MRRLFLLIVLLPGVVPASAQIPQRDGAAFDLLREAYSAVFDGPAYHLEFEIETVGLDSTTVDTGRATSQVDLDTGLPWFVATFDQGETRRVAFDDATYQVDFPRTQTVYVDSTREKVWTGTAWMLMMHPAFGIGTHFFVQDAVTTTVAGVDESAVWPCERAVFEMEAGVEFSVCVEVETAFPVETRLVDPDGTSITFQVMSFEPLDGLPREAFQLDPDDGFERVPYDDDTLPLASGTPAPAFTAEGEDGPVALADYAGRYVLLDFWGTWCGPCVEAIPELQATAEAHPDLVVLGLASHEYADADPAGFVRQRGGTYPIARADEALLKAYHVRAFPTYYLIGPDGAILFSSVSDRDPEAKGALADLLASLFPD